MGALLTQSDHKYQRSAGPPKSLFGKFWKLWTWNNMKVKVRNIWLIWFEIWKVFSNMIVPLTSEKWDGRRQTVTPWWMLRIACGGFYPRIFPARLPGLKKFGQSWEIGWAQGNCRVKVDLGGLDEDDDCERQTEWRWCNLAFDCDRVLLVGEIQDCTQDRSCKRL